MRTALFYAGLPFLVMTAACHSGHVDADKNLQYCTAQASKTVQAIPHDSANIPRSIDSGKIAWHYVNYRDWTSGFWPGILWYAYEYTKDTVWKNRAMAFSAQLIPLS